MESVIEKFNAATAPGPDRVTAGAVIASATMKGAHHVSLQAFREPFSSSS
jgi:hypothetical protein